MGNIFPLNQGHRPLLIAGIMLLVALWLGTGQLLLASDDELMAASLDGSDKEVEEAEALPGSTLQYTIVLSNSGDTSTGVIMTDTLPSEITFVGGDLSPNVTNGFGSGGYSNGVITWTGTLGSNGFVEITFDATLTTTISPDTTVTNTAEITGTGSLITRTATTLVVSEPPTRTVYLPVVSRPIPGVTLQVTPPANNVWTVSWNSAGPDITGYELEESNSADFSAVTTYNLAANTTSQQINHPPTVNNVYYYRVRPKVNTQAGPWSNVVSVTGQQPTLTLQITRPNSANDWSVSWNEAGGAAGYELQEADNADFTNPTVYNLGPVTSYVITSHDPSLNNEFYYRVRAVAGNNGTAWSNVQHVIAGYRDDFGDSGSGWAIRRTTLLGDVRSFYENNWLVVQVEDRWDWGIASPYKVKPPSLPYMIEYSAQSANETPRASHGAVFGGDWPGTICPDYSSEEGLYRHQLCFNHFYNTNTILSPGFDPVLLFERVDQLVWCPTCGGSPMKRIGATQTTTLTGVNVTNWNIYRVEVRSDSIKVFINDVLRYEYGDTRWVNDPYFGIFMSADDYSGSTWRIDWLRVVPLDS